MTTDDVKGKFVMILFGHGYSIHLDERRFNFKCEGQQTDEINEGIN
jgi:hypothetical protein